MIGGIIVGMLIGAPIGAILMGICCASKDRREETWERESKPSE